MSYYYKNILFSLPRKICKLSSRRKRKWKKRRKGRKEKMNFYFYSTYLKSGSSGWKTQIQHLLTKYNLNFILSILIYKISIIIVPILKNIYLFNLGRERGSRRGRSILSTEHGIPYKAQFQDLETMFWAEIKNWLLNRLSHPCALGNQNSSPCYLTSQLYDLRQVI